MLLNGFGLGDFGEGCFFGNFGVKSLKKENDFLHKLYLKFSFASCWTILISSSRGFFFKFLNFCSLSYLFDPLFVTLIPFGLFQYDLGWDLDKDVLLVIYYLIFENLGVRPVFRKSSFSVNFLLICYPSVKHSSILSSVIFLLLIFLA